MSCAPHRERAGRYNSLRLLGHDYSNLNDDYFITICAIAGNPFFADIQLAKQVISLLLDMHEGGMIQVFAYVLMPDHFHGLLKTTDKVLPLPYVLGYFKSKTTRIYWKQARRALRDGKVSFYGERSGERTFELLQEWRSFGVLPETLKINNLQAPAAHIFQSKRLWQDSYYDRVIRSEEEFDEKLRYILDNPVRRGYVAEGWMYPFSGMVSV